MTRMPHAILAIVMLSALGTAGACSADGGATTAPAPGPCRVTIPADLTQRPARWMGGCVKGAAEGLGVLRVGQGEPYQFFLGRMAGGRPVQGVLKVNGSQVIPAYRFDTDGRGVNPDGNQPEQLTQVFRTGSAGARAVAGRFAAQGNKASATYYTKLAQDYRSPPFE
jgi:hypothetical protein